METVEEKALNEIERQQKEAGIAFLGTIYLEVPEFNAVKNALKKRIPKRPINTRREIVCPTCRTLVGSSPYCRYCGQMLDHTTHPTEKGR